MIGRTAAALALVASAAQAEPSALATKDQIAIDLRAVRILERPEIQAEKPALHALYARDPGAATPDGKARIDAPLDAIMFSCVLNAVDGDPDRPRIVWDAAAPHRWNGVTVPASGYGLDNPDNVYRQVAIDGAARYKIKGRRAQGGPAQLSFTLYRALPGSGSADKTVREGSPVLGALSGHDLETGADGSFTVTIDRDPPNGRPNHIQSSDGREEILIVRDTLADWTKEQPVALTVARTGGPSPRSAPDDATLAARAKGLMEAMVPFWIKYGHDFVFTSPANTVQPPQKRDGGWGYAAMGHFDLAPDEAMEITVEPLGAKYVGFQITDLWSVAPDYIHHQSSLNAHQAQTNPDGSITYVIAETDPGVPNWIDTVGMHAGMLIVRWQELADRNVSAEHAVREVKIVKLAGLGPAQVSASERAASLKARAATYQKRLGG